MYPDRESNPGRLLGRQSCYLYTIKALTTTTTGFEPARVEPNGFQVHRLNHSATLSIIRSHRDSNSGYQIQSLMC